MPDILIIVYSCLAILMAGVVRGYSGFGFSMIAVLSLSLVLPLVNIVPCILILETAASLWLLPKIWKDVDWLSLKWILLGVLVGTPIGIYILTSVSDMLMRIFISVIVIILVGFLWRGFRFKNMPGRMFTSLVGLFSGILNGGAAIAGPPVVIYYFALPRTAAVGRASLIALFFATDIIAIGNLLVQDMIRNNTILLTAIFLIPMLIGVTIGSRAFVKVDERSFRIKVFQLLLALSMASLFKAVW